MKKILITGGAGFVGRAFVKHYLKQNHDVTVVDNLNKIGDSLHPIKGWPLFNPFEYESFKFIEMDCRKYLIENSGIYFDYVIHCAAIVGGRNIIENHSYELFENFDIDYSIIKWATEAKPGKLILFSSSAVYPLSLQSDSNYRLLKESDVNPIGDVLAPDTVYGRAKLQLEYLALNAVNECGVKAVVYRPFSGYGEGQSLNYPFSSICLKVLNADKNNPRVEVWGTGDQMRDFIHIDDIVNMVVNSCDEFSNAEAINLSSGVYTSMRSLALIAANYCNRSISVTGRNEKPMGVFARGGDRMKQLDIGIHNTISVEEGVSRVVSYLKRDLIE